MKQKNSENDNNQRNHSIPLTRLERIADRDQERLDIFLARVYPWRSRRQFQKLIAEDRALVNGKISTRTRLLKVNDRVVLEVDPEPVPDYDALKPELLYSDEQLMFVNKPAGLPAHPVYGHPYHNLLSVLHYHYRDDAYLPQLIHRLDEYTTGVIVAARARPSHNHLRRQFYHRKVGKVYLALTAGDAPPGGQGVIDAPIGIDPKNETRSAITDAGKPAVSHYLAVATVGDVTLFAVRPLTGRQHQVRIHLAHLGFPLLGDQRYGGPETFARPALHAYQLSLQHPVSGEQLTVTAPIPEDFVQVMKRLGIDPDHAADAAVRLLAI